MKRGLHQLNTFSQEAESIVIVVFLLTRADAQAERAPQLDLCRGNRAGGHAAGNHAALQELEVQVLPPQAGQHNQSS